MLRSLALFLSLSLSHPFAQSRYLAHSVPRGPLMHYIGQLFEYDIINNSLHTLRRVVYMSVSVSLWVWGCVWVCKEFLINLKCAAAAGGGAITIASRGGIFQLRFLPSFLFFFYPRTALGVGDLISKCSAMLPQLLLLVLLLRRLVQSSDLCVSCHSQGDMARMWQGDRTRGICLTWQL